MCGNHLGAFKMILGMSPLLAFHVAISLVCIATGFVVLWGMLNSRRMDVLTLVFLATAITVDVTGFPLPPFGLDPPRILGIISLVVLVPALVARYGLGMVGIWRAVFVVTATMTLYFNVFVLITQGFLKVTALHALAPNGNEPPFGIAQGIALLLFIALGWLAVRRFRPKLG
jgi:hypothetical protein